MLQNGAPGYQLVNTSFCRRGLLASTDASLLPKEKGGGNARVQCTSYDVEPFAGIGWPKSAKEENTPHTTLVCT